MPKRKRVPSSSLGTWAGRQKGSPSCMGGHRITKEQKESSPFSTQDLPTPSCLSRSGKTETELPWPCESSLRQSRPSVRNLRKFPGQGKSGNIQAKGPLRPLQQLDGSSRGSFLVGWGRCLCSWQIIFRDVK